MKPKSSVSVMLYELMIEKGYSEEFSDLVTKNLNTDFTAARMVGYLSHYSDLPEGEVVDEMLAILSDRNRFVEKHRTEQAQAHISEFYNSSERGE